MTSTVRRSGVSPGTASGLFVGFAALIALATVTACERDSARKPPPADSAMAFPATPAAAPAHHAGHAGLQYDSMPRDFAYRGGSVLPRDPALGGADYDFALVTTPTGDEIWLDSLGAPARAGARASTRGKVVRAVLPVPPMERDERLLMASCDANGKLDPRIVAIVVTESSGSRFARIRQAWRANIPAARFDPIPVAGIVCEDPGS